MKANRLSKILAAAGVASRRASEDLIFAGRVTVNGELVKVPQTHVDPGKDKILVDGEPLKRSEGKVTFLLNKPKGYICTSKAGNYRRVVDLFADRPERLFTVGRLDKETTGLLLVTNDGELSHKIIHPSAGVQKEYLVKLAQDPGHQELVRISNGTHVEGVLVKPLSVKKMRRGTLKITVMEGRNREVRRLMAGAGLDVVELTRIRLGNLHLGKLPSGGYKPLTKKDLEKAFIFI